MQEECAEPLPMHKGFLDIDGKLLHYARQGKGPPLVMLHAAPCSLRVMEPLQAEWGADFTTFAFDLPGFGMSEMLEKPDLTTADLADAVASGIQMLGLSRVMLYGRHTGAGVAVELALRHPDLCSFVLTDGFPVFAKPYTEERLAEYLTPIEPSWDGGHLTWAWFRYREQHMFWPWDKPLLSQRADTDLPDIDFLYRGATELLTASETYVRVYSSAFRHAGLGMISEVKVPVIYGNRPGDSQYKTVPLYPETATVQIFPRDHQAAAVEELATLRRHAPEVETPPHREPVLGDGLSRNYVSTSRGAVHFRCAAMGKDSVPTIFLPDLPGGIDLHLEEIKALVGEGPVLAIDPWGNGLSILPGEEQASLEIWVDQLEEIIDQFGLGKINIYAHGTSAAIAVEFSQRYPQRVTHVTFRSPPAFEMEDRVSFAAAYAPDISPEWTGGNFLKLWHHMRDQELWWPWNQRTTANARCTAPRIDPKWLHRRAVILLRQPAQYRCIWQTVLQYPLLDHLWTMDSSCKLISDPQDLFAFAAKDAGIALRVAPKPA